MSGTATPVGIPGNCPLPIGPPPVYLETPPPFLLAVAAAAAAAPSAPLQASPLAGATPIDEEEELIDRVRLEEHLFQSDSECDDGDAKNGRHDIACWNTVEHNSNLGLSTISAETWLHGVELKLAMREGGDIRQMCKLAAKMSARPEIATEICDSIDSCVTSIPNNRHLNIGIIRLDCLSMVWSRRRMANEICWRFCQVDASPVRGQNFLNIRVDTFAFPLDVDWSVAMTQLHKYYRRETFPPGFLGNGRAGVVEKVVQFTHRLRLMAGVENMDKMRGEFCGTGADQSVEYNIGDAPYVADTNLDGLRESINGILSQEVTPSSADGYLLPNNVTATDTLHIIFWGLANAVKTLPSWKTTETHLRNIVTFLNNKPLRTRFRQQCCPDHATSNAFKFWSKQYIDWEFEFLEETIAPLMPLIPLLLRFYIVANMRAPDAAVDDGNDAEARAEEREKNSKLVKLVSEALSYPNLDGLLECLLMVAYACGVQARWAEGCPCHEHIWTRKINFAAKMRAFVEETGLPFCVFKGRRGTELALGYVSRRMVPFLRDFRSDRFSAILLASDAVARTELLSMESTLKCRMIELVLSKFGYWEEPPWSRTRSFGFIFLHN